MADGNPWADPDSPTSPYAGPPATDRPVSYGSPYPVPGHTPAYPGYGHPAPWPPLPARPRKPGQVIAAAVIAFVQAALVLLASVYVLFLSSVVGIAADADPSSAPESAQGLATEGLVLGLVQVVSAVLLVGAGVLALNSRRRAALALGVVSFAVQIVLCVYWAVRLTALSGDIPGADPTGALVAFTLLFLGGPAVGLGLLLLGAGRRWFESAVPAEEVR